ncbi:hypothetical protein [Streptomyces sp. R17]|uniref:Uncharacterized protein n=1 Tax=Streptomyces sp. R17 TaxID=3238626 RepID=A0AB39P1S1_9ACTN
MVSRSVPVLTAGAAGHLQGGWGEARRAHGEALELPRSRGQGHPCEANFPHTMLKPGFWNRLPGSDGEADPLRRGNTTPVSANNRKRWAK